MLQNLDLHFIFVGFFGVFLAIFKLFFMEKINILLKVMFFYIGYEISQNEVKNCGVLKIDEKNLQK